MANDTAPRQDDRARGDDPADAAPAVPADEPERDQVDTGDDDSDDTDEVSRGTESVTLDPRFVEFRRTGDRRLRNQLVEANRDLATRAARRFANRGEPLDDLVQVAMVGLLKSVERFDPARGLAFSSFAMPTITGEIKRHFRDRTWSIRVPRRTQETRLALAPVSERLQQDLGRPPTVPELAEALNVTTDDVIQALEAGSAYRPTSISAPVSDSDGGGRELESTLGSDPTERMNDNLALAQLMERLPERERTILRLRFFEDLTQSEIAARLDISQMHVSRLLRRTLLELREQLERTAP
jgi:RNA polymerase sigma-B factor